MAKLNMPVQGIVPTGTLMHLRPDEIKRSETNPRHLFDRPQLESLKKSIREKGVLVPITVYQPKGQSKFSILDGERRFRCVVELTDEGFQVEIPANIVEPPTKIAGLLYMFSIHNYREAWELMPTALGLKIIIEELGVSDAKELAKHTGLSGAQVERCKKLLEFEEEFQQLSLDPDPKTRIPSNFWIELLPVLGLVQECLPELWGDLGRKRLIYKLIEKYRARKIKSVIHFRKILEGYEISDATRRALIVRRLQEFILNPAIETRAAFDEFVVDRKRIQNALSACEIFLTQLQQLKLRYTADEFERSQLKESLKQVIEYCRSLEQELEGSDPPEPTQDE
jgi:ParB family transcriptional regulator, chromosome partitioning protein